ncbi:MAG: bifunctional hydroxymethylpyrimidine kinase/phosphomethylpyrimidine kinase [Terrimicrobiaceae bacterium]|nr:bifunctional hydroxymethylpyrimidine kinase/phosphomethylpyrimidine kinase [Terrimicrobiaceae bacterium]
MSRASGPPVVLTIAGSDNSGGAGLQADLKTITALGGYALTAVTCVVAEVPGKVSMIQPVRAAVVAEQVRLCFAAFPVGAVKTGMLHSAAIIEAVIDALLAAAARSGTKPALVVDPVMVASSGDLLLKPSAVLACRRHLLPLATLVTPNLNELEVLAGRRIANLREMEAAGAKLAAEFGAAFLLKGGHLRGREAVDVLVEPGGRGERFVAPFIRGADPHGTGCTYSAAIATGLARGASLCEAVGGAKEFITRAIARRHRWGSTEILAHDRP